MHNLRYRNLQQLATAFDPPTALPGEDVAVPAERSYTGTVAGHVSEAFLLLNVP